ncbi:unnamed protein product [Brassica napus]|uniref:(rape) hypothetical protein n=1 Tax=Brassica napus TaxID=3708 RepID=A0A817AQ83_BRANA|nr:unnamed protein product [Brassica napus]
MTSISDLPNCLVEQILSRLPLKSMRAVRLTCKEWDTLSKSRSFAKMHIDKLSAEYMEIATMDNNLYLKEDPFKGKYVCLDKQIKISQVFHCDGLLLCVLGEDYTKIIVWNPYWGQTRSIETRCYHGPCGCDRFSYALGYEDKKSCRSYKILRFVDHEYYENAPEDHQQFVLYEIYDFDSGLWRILDVTPHWRISLGQGTLSLKGNTYWPALHYNSVPGMLSDDHIICFDFTSETFGPLIPLPFGRIPGYVTLSCVREEEEEEKLGVLLRWPYLEFGIWVTAKIEAGKVSWSENLSVDTIPYHPLLFIDDEEKEVTTSFEDDRFILDDTEDTYCSAHIGSYVPSLAQIKQPSAGCKRKQQCDLETQEYDQNRLTLEKRSKECNR